MRVKICCKWAFLNLKINYQVYTSFALEIHLSSGTLLLVQKGPSHLTRKNTSSTLKHFQTHPPLHQCTAHHYAYDLPPFAHHYIAVRGSIQVPVQRSMLFYYHLHLVSYLESNLNALINFCFFQFTLCSGTPLFTVLVTVKNICIFT